MRWTLISAGSMCLGCKTLKAFLKANEIPYGEIDLRGLGPEEQSEILKAMPQLLTDLACNTVADPFGCPTKPELLRAPILWDVQSGEAWPASWLLDAEGQVSIPAQDLLL